MLLLMQRGTVFVVLNMGSVKVLEVQHSTCYEQKHVRQLNTANQLEQESESIKIVPVDTL